MTSKDYTLTYGHTLLQHQPFKSWFVNDLEANMSNDELDLVALIRSGDYFETLATTLDTVKQDIMQKDLPGSELLEQAITQLLYLQKTHQIVKK